jgi:hypothetical protein
MIKVERKEFGLERARDYSITTTVVRAERGTRAAFVRLLACGAPHEYNPASVAQ